MNLSTLVRLWLRLFPIVATSPFFFGYALFVLTRAVVRGIRHGELGTRALAPVLHCPHGHEVPVVSRWSCASCHAEYLGWIGRCTVCGEGADFTRCPTCQVGVRLPWEAP